MSAPIFLANSFLKPFIIIIVTKINIIQVIITQIVINNIISIIFIMKIQKKLHLIVENLYYNGVQN